MVINLIDLIKGAGGNRKGNQLRTLSPRSVLIRWSEVLESAFEHYHSKFLVSWALDETRYNSTGDKILIEKHSSRWVSWDGITWYQRPHIATLFDLMPDLPADHEFHLLLRSLLRRGVRNPEDHFWENIFTYHRVNELYRGRRKYNVIWIA